jgi:hypothetical protein
MLLATLRIIAYAWLGVLVISTVILGLLYVVELAARAIQRRRRSRS